jgi:hypothetical protein
LRVGPLEGLRAADCRNAASSLRRRRGVRPRATEQSAEETAALLPWLTARFKLLNALLELTDALVSLLKRVFLDQNGLNQHVRGVRHLPDGLIDQGLRIPILLDGAEPTHAVEKTVDKLAFIGGHMGISLCCLPGLCRRGLRPHKVGSPQYFFAFWVSEFAPSLSFVLVAGLGIAPGIEEPKHVVMIAKARSLRALQAKESNVSRRGAPSRRMRLFPAMAHEKQLTRRLVIEGRTAVVAESGRAPEVCLGLRLERCRDTARAASDFVAGDSGPLATAARLST